MARKRNRSSHDEPSLEGEEWVEWGGELIWAAGFTSGGAPYGLTVDQYREATMQESREAGWARAKRILSDVFGSRVPPDASLDIGWVKYLDEGLFRKGYWADVEIDPDPNEHSGRYVVLLPKRDVDSDFERVTSQLSTTTMRSTSSTSAQASGLSIRKRRPSGANIVRGTLGVEEIVS